MPYTQFVLGYARETTYALSPITDASGTAHLLGITPSKTRLPDPVARLETLPPSYDKVEIQGAWKSIFRVASTFAVVPQDALPIWFAMGKSISSGASPPYTHIITCPTISSGVMPELPSLTLHAESLGTGVTTFVRQFTGMKMSRMDLSCSVDQKFLIAEIDWVGSKAERKGFVLTSKPQNLITPKPKPYMWVSSIRKFNSVALDTLTRWRLSIDNSVELIYALMVDAGGNDVSQWAQFALDGAVKKYELELEFLAKDYTFWDELVALVNDKTFEAEFTRIAGQDTLKFTAEKCHIVDAPHPIPDPKGENLIATVSAVPESVTVTAKDSIDKSYFGES